MPKPKRIRDLSRRPKKHRVAVMFDSKGLVATTTDPKTKGGERPLLKANIDTNTK